MNDNIVSLYHEYRECYEQLNLSIHSLVDWIERFEETGFYGYAKENVQQLSETFLIERDKLGKLSDLLKEISRQGTYKKCKDFSLRVPENQRVPIPIPETVDSICTLLGYEWDRLNIMAKELKRWPNVKAAAYVFRLKLVLNALVECRDLIVGPDACRADEEDDTFPDQTEHSFDAAELFDDQKEDSFLIQDDSIQSMSELSDDDDDDFYIDIDSPDKKADVSQVFRSLLDALHALEDDIPKCLSLLNSHSQGDGITTIQRCLEAKDDILECALTVEEGLDRLYANLSDAQAWLGKTYGEAYLARFMPTFPDFLLNTSSEWEDVIYSLDASLQEPGEDTSKSSNSDSSHRSREDDFLDGDLFDVLDDTDLDEIFEAYASEPKRSGVDCTYDEGLPKDRKSSTPMETSKEEDDAFIDLHEEADHKFEALYSSSSRTIDENNEAIDALLDENNLKESLNKAKDSVERLLSILAL